jgi:hypothetical protein
MGRKTLIASGIGILAAVALAAGSWVASSRKKSERGPVAVLSLPQSRIEGSPGSPAAKATFQIANRGDADLVLGEPSSTCGCTVPSLSPRVLRPGASATGLIDARPPQVGQKTVEVDIPTNAPAEDGGVIRFRLTLVGTAKPPYVVNASGTVQLGETTGKEVAAEVRLQTREASSSPPWIGSAISSIPELGVNGGIDDERPLEGGIVDRVYTFKVAPTSSLKVGDVAGEIQFLSNGSDGGVAHKLPILGRILPRVYARPSRLFARLTPDSSPPRLHFSVQSADLDPELEVEPLEWPRDAVEIELTGRTSSRLDFVAVPRPGLHGDLNSELILSTNDLDVPRVAIPLTLLRATARP